MDSGSRTLEFFVAATVRTKGNNKRIVRFGKRLGLVGKTQDVEAETNLVARLLEFRPETPMTEGVRLDVTFVLPIPTGFPLWKRAAALAGRFRPITRPDRGNALKLVEDALEGAFYVNDSLVVTGEVGKVYGEIPGYRIRLEELVQATRASEAALASSL